MKRIIIYLMAAAAVICSCEKQAEIEANSGLVVTIDVAPATKATEAGVDALNENRIETLDWFICSGDDASSSILYAGKTAIGESITSKTVTLDIPTEDFNTLFPAAADSRSLYVIANAGSAIKANPATVQDLLDTEFAIQNSGQKQDSFIMTGNGSAVRQNTANPTAKASVKLCRSLSKVRLTLDVSKFADFRGGDKLDPQASPYTNSVRYTADVTNVKVTLHNAAAKGNITGLAVTDSGLFDFETKSYAKTSETALRFTAATTDPYYSCPRSWELGSDNEPYFMVMIPWKADTYDSTGNITDSKPAQATYYKVIFSSREFRCNTIYDIKVKLEGLGSLVEDKPVTVDDIHLEIIDWMRTHAGDVVDTEAEFIDARVLDIPQETVNLYNQTSAQFPYYTSHACRIDSVVLFHNTFNNTTGATIVNKTKITSATEIAKIVTLQEDIEGQNNHIRFTHELHNDISNSNLDYTDYVYHVYLRHADDSQGIYKDEITIRQTPAILVEANANSDGLSKNTTTFVNGKKYGQTIDFGTLNGDLRNANNTNNNMYVMTVTRLEGYKLKREGTPQAIVGDPRKASPDMVGLDSGSKQAVSAASVQGTNRKLQNYYPTDGDLNTVVAPKIRVASTHGLTNTMDHNTAIKRCATYQEDGYPAGRWRLPTEAEIEFIITLSTYKFIPKLFNTGGSYWCATGRVVISSSDKVSFNKNNDGSYFARCVYDEWYWENTDYPTVSKNTFTWGDMPR